MKLTGLKLTEPLKAPCVSGLTDMAPAVCGTGTLKIKFSGFSWEYAYTHYYLIPKNLVYYQVRLLSRICLG